MLVLIWYNSSINQITKQMKKIFENEFEKDLMVALFKVLMIVLFPVLIAYLSSFISDKLILPAYCSAFMSLGMFEKDKENYIKNRIFWFGKAVEFCLFIIFFSYAWFILHYLEGSTLFLQAIAFPASVFALMYLFVAVMKWFDARQTLINPELEQKDIDSGQAS